MNIIGMKRTHFISIFNIRDNKVQAIPPIRPIFIPSFCFLHCLDDLFQIKIETPQDVAILLFHHQVDYY